MIWSDKTLTNERYWIGEKVIVKKDCDGVTGFIGLMVDAFGGTVMTVLDVGENHYIMKEDHGLWYWADQMFVGPYNPLPPSFSPDKKTLPLL